MIAKKPCKSSSHQKSIKFPNETNEALEVNFFFLRILFLTLTLRNTFRVVCLWMPWISCFRASMDVCVIRVILDTWVSASCLLLLFRVVPVSLLFSAFVRCRGATACWMPKPKNLQQRTHFFEQNEMFNSRLDSISILLLQALGLRELESVWNRWTRDMQMFDVVWEKVGEVSVVKF